MAAILACPAYAQTQAPAPPPTAAAAQPASAASSAGPGIADIVVTAQRRSENSQRAAVPIDVLSGSDLTKAGITKTEDLGKLSPSLVISPSSGGRTSLFVRGVGNFTANPQFDSAIAFNYDGVYIGKPGGTSGFFYDLQRVEILLGPQGTLYGRNATGGAINVIPVHPQLGKYTGYLTGSYGNYNAYTLEGALNIPIGDNSALRVSGNRTKHDGYLSDGSSADDSAAGRVQFLTNVTPNLTIRVGGDYSQVRGLSAGASYVGSYQRGTFVGSGLNSSIGLNDPRAQAYRESLFVAPIGRFSDPLQALSTVDSNNYGFQAEVSLKTGPGTLIFIPSWRHADSVDNNQQIGTYGYVKSFNEQLSFELRFLGDRIGMFDYQVGAYYLKEDSRFHYGIDQVSLYNQEDITQGTKSYAGFARVTAHLNDRLRLVGGVRYTEDKKYFTDNKVDLVVDCLSLPTPCLTTPYLPSVPALSDGPPGPYRNSAPGVTPLFANGAPTGAILINTPVLSNLTYSKGKITWRAAAEYDIGPKSLLYASVETGYRSGVLQAAAGYQVLQPETITAYTAGSKNRFFGNRLQLNVEGFYWKYKNQQLTSITLDNDGVQGNFAKNIGNSTNYGVDIDTIVLPTPTTRLDAKIQYLHAYYNSFIYTAQAGPSLITPCPMTVAGTIATINCSGRQAYNAPTWTLNLGAQQTVNLDDYKAVLSLDTQFKTSRWVGFEYLQGEQQAASWTTNAQVELSPQNERWSVAAYVRNIENERLTVNAFNWSFAGAITAISSPPRTYGVRASVKF